MDRSERCIDNIVNRLAPALKARNITSLGWSVSGTPGRRPPDARALKELKRGRGTLTSKNHPEAEATSSLRAQTEIRSCRMEDRTARLRMVRARLFRACIAYKSLKICERCRLQSHRTIQAISRYRQSAFTSSICRGVLHCTWERTGFATITATH